MSYTFIKRVSATRNFVFDFAPLENGREDSDWLDRTSSPVESIQSAVVTAESPGITVSSYSVTDNSTSVTIKVTGGSAGMMYNITCTIVTTKGQTEVRTARVMVISDNA